MSSLPEQTARDGYTQRGNRAGKVSERVDIENAVPRVAAQHVEQRNIERLASRLRYRAQPAAIDDDYSILIPTLLTKFASTTVRISFPCRITTKYRLNGDSGFPGTISVSVPVQFGLTI
jgi:hypothetical protein